MKGKKAKKEETKEAYRILIKPLVTEKATNLVAKNQYTFMVANGANKIEVKKAIKGLYGFEAKSVNIIKARGKDVRSGKVTGKKKNWRKAIVTLKPSDKIEIYEGV
ncbi:MAG: 50S ribosomal protein L23 [Patescibacteria group bacterium]